MLDTIKEPKHIQDTAAAWEDAAHVCRLIPPLWDLSNYVAVNPFLGFAASPIDQAAREIGDGLGACVLPRLEYYRERWKTGDFGPVDLTRAARRRGVEATALESIMEGRGEPPMRSVQSTLTQAERHDSRFGGDWENVLVRHITRWCAVYASKGGSYWSLPGLGSQRLYRSWREAAIVDRSLEILGIKGWRRWAEALPERAVDALPFALARLEVSAAERPAYLYRLLGGVYGWASYFRRDSWADGDDLSGPLTDLLVIRACADAAVVEAAPRRSVSGRTPDAAIPRAEEQEESTRLVFQEALEDAFARRALGRFNSPAEPSQSRRPAVQAVFCIDVRSEPFRRRLESQSDAVETLGFAGFFGVPLDWRSDGSRSSARCPVLIKPTVAAQSLDADPNGVIGAAAKQLQGAPAAAFNYVEVMGLAYGLGLAADALRLRPSKDTGEATTAIDLDSFASPNAKEALAAGVLKNTGLGAMFARIVLLCGHKGRSANNPHAAGLNCGACGGHGGAVNARIAAALLNDPVVRDGLRGRGWDVPADTHFLAGIHDTSVDEVALLDVDRVPPSHAQDLDDLRIHLARAGDLTRAERASDLGLPDKPSGLLKRWLRDRSRDWSEVRPEWGLARNAAFIAARRRRTRGVDLQGRAFLHEYDATLDPDGSVLTLIMNAPMIVGAWINLQYFASTVDNDHFGCGTKALHNRVGDIGVVLGNGGDLRTGLAAQSVHASNGRWFHEPLRLHVVIEAHQSKIDEVLAAHSSVRALVKNGWVRLFALDPDGSRMLLRLPDGAWETFIDDEAPSIRPAGPG